MSTIWETTGLGKKLRSSSGKAPLVDAGLTKAEIRELSRLANLSTWDRPAAAASVHEFLMALPSLLRT